MVGCISPRRIDGWTCDERADKNTTHRREEHLCGESGETRTPKPVTSSQKVRVCGQGAPNARSRYTILRGMGPGARAGPAADPDMTAAQRVR